ncbi:MAG: hypothetical protein JXQ97_04465 [Natronospirillum sp.]
MPVFRGLRLPRAQYPLPPLTGNKIYYRLTCKNDQPVALPADKVLASDGYSPNSDDSTLVGEKGYSLHGHKVTDKLCNVAVDLRGDFLIYGWRPWMAPMTLLWAISGGFGITALIAALTTEGESIHWVWDWPGVAFCAVLFYISFWWYFRSPFSHYIVFDRRHRLIHLPRWFSHKQDSIRWEDADLCVLDMLTGYFHESITTELSVVPPPLSLQQQGTKPWWRFFKYHYDSKRPVDLKEHDGYPAEGAEAVFRFIVDFMTRPPEQSVALDAMSFKDMGIEMKQFGNNDFERTIKNHKEFWSLIDPERLPTEPNWVRDEHGHWQQVRPAVRARFGWFGLWNKSYTLPPHLRGTRADPACKNDPLAPLPVSRWFAVEDGGTGELVGQPADVLAAVLRGEGMPSKESLAQTRLKEGGWPGPERDWWYEQFEEQVSGQDKAEP